MIKILNIKPFFTKVLKDGRVRITFAYKHFLIEKDGDVFQFVPLEAKDIYYDVKNNTITNKSDVFVFQRGNRSIRLALRQLEAFSNVRREIFFIAESALGVNSVTAEELNGLMDEILEMNINHAIDLALTNNDEKMFNELVNMYKSLDKSIKL